MHERIISTSAANIWAVALMLVGCGLIVANYFDCPTNDHLGFVGLPFICGGCVARIRALLCKLQGSMHEMFAAGREIGRMEGEGSSVRSLR